MCTPYVNKKGSDQTVHPHSLISNFVGHFFDSIIPIVAKPNVSSLSLVSVAEHTGLSLTWSHTTDARFSRDDAQIKLVLMRAITLSRVLGVQHCHYQCLQQLHECVAIAGRTNIGST